MSLSIDFFLLGLFLFFNGHAEGSPEKKIKVLCDDGLMSEVRTLVNKIPDKIASQIHNCIQELEPNLATADVGVKCPKGSLQVPAKYYNVVQHPIEFADCGSSVIQSMEDELSAADKEKVKYIEMVRTLAYGDQRHETWKWLKKHMFSRGMLTWKKE